jgi:glycine/D-amino acid oxidase-like deaminating enzyme/nitrite reductase/ring-hydroxylating ferredoxin subunit
MTAPQGRHVSPWEATMTRPELGSTAFRDVAADVLVLGAGVTGLTTALLLQRAGRRVAIIEASRFGDSVTTRSTVKVTVGHGTVYSRIANARDRDTAAAYAQANSAGFEQVVRLAEELAPDCMLETGLPHVVYAEAPEQAAQLDREAELASSLGLRVARTDQPPLPFEVDAAISFEQQAQFHPGRYLAGLAAAFVAEGGTLVEGVRATGVDEDRDVCHVDTQSGRLSAPHVIVATHYPILDRGGQFGWLKPTRSYGVVGVLPDDVPAGMTINSGSPTHSTRTAQLDGEQLLVVVGEGHEVGHVNDTGERWVRLQDWARERFGVQQFRYHWSAQELHPLDHVPFVGPTSPASHRVLCATGFAGWGMTNGTAAALMLRDLVLGAGNPWLHAFDARRAETSVPPVRSFLRQNVEVARRWVKGRVVGAPDGDPRELQPGEAAIVEADGEQTAAYRDDAGVLHAVSAVCTHLKCTVEWNDGERSWDCPCHGSRFDVDGDVLHGPASTPLAARDVGA